MTEKCEFVAGLCIHCGDTAQGECLGWNAPEDEIKELRQQIETLAKDAARYRFVRTADTLRISPQAARDPVVYDAAIDKAIEAAQAEKT